MAEKEKRYKKRENEKDSNEKTSDSSCKDDACQKEVVELKEQLLRVNADFQNFKKRIEKEKTEWIAVGQATVIELFLPFIDDLDRAITSCDEQELDKKDSWLEGFILIQKSLKKTFKDLGIQEIDCTNKFDPEYHEALMQVDSKDHKSGEIVQVFNKGYLFKDKVLRHAKVSVAK